MYQELKKCNKCQRDLPKNTDYFFKKHDTKDGFTNMCKECKGKKFTNKLTKKARNGYKFCKKCDRELPATVQFYPPDKECKDGTRNVCRECGKDGHFMNDNYIPKQWWSIEEEELLAKVYPYYLNKELIEIYFPSKTEKELWDKVYKMNKEKGYKVYKTEKTIKKRYKLHSANMSGENSPNFGKVFSKETREKISKSRKGRFVGENSPLYGIPKTDEHRRKLSLARSEMGLWKGDKNPRHLNPLIKEKNGMWKGGISELNVHLRRFIKPWKEDSMKSCNYKCVITGGEFDNIHHLFNFSNILNETMKLVNLPIYEQVNNYSEIQLEIIEQTCLKLHYDYGMGVCLRKDIHKLFHDLYGYNNNTPQQFEDFKLRFNTGEFNKFSNERSECHA